MMRKSKIFILGAAGLAVSGCVAAVPVAPTYTVIPGQGKTETNLRADDAACRGAPAAGSTTATVAPTQATGLTAEQYYQCMASRGEAVIQEQPRAYPAYAVAAPAYVPYAYSAVAPYPYPYYGYGYPYGVGYPFGVGYFGPYVGFGVGFGYGGFYGGRGFYRGGFGGYRGGYGGFRGGYGGGFHR